MSGETTLSPEALNQRILELPKDKQDALRHWFATQALIVEVGGIAEEEWAGLLHWAMEHPFDFSFIDELPTEGEEADAIRETAKSQSELARERLGQKIERNAVEGKGLRKSATKEGLEGELFRRFMNNQLNQGTPGARKRPEDRRGAGAPAQNTKTSKGVRS